MPETRRLRILWIKVGGLWPPDRGGRLRSFHLLRELARRHEVTLLTTHGPDDDPEQLAARLPDGTRVVSTPYRPPKKGSARFLLTVLRSWIALRPADVFKFRVPALAREARRLLRAGAVDLCVADFLSATANLPARGAAPVLLFEHNVEHLIWKGLARLDRSFWRRRLLAIEWRLLRRHEARSVARAALTVAVSELDRARLMALAPGAAVETVPTGVDTAQFQPGEAAEAPGSIAFVGSMDWHPNEDAVRHCLRAILPRIRAAVPGASLTVIGRNPSSGLREAARSAGVEVTGTVPDVRPYLARAAVVVVPLRIGGGTRLKIFEALAMAKAVVSTTIGAEGLPVTPGVHFVQTDDETRFAEEVAALLGDPERRRRFGEAGRRLVESRYAWPQVALRFEALCRAAAGPAPRPEETDPRPAATNPDPTAAGAAARLDRKRRWLNHARAWLHLSPGALARYRRGQVRRTLCSWRAGREAIPSGTRSILFVCQGNIIRSPMAAALMRRALAGLAGEAPRIESAGLRAEPGRPADQRAIQAASWLGLDLTGHRARRVTPEEVNGADRIVAMDALIEAELLDRFPLAADRIVLLTGEDAGGRAREREVLDPYDGDEGDVRRCYLLLRSLVQRQASVYERQASRWDGLEAHHAY
ncbi:MAG TPA: glycosyltransferase [Candidatus Polarisedimenticolia bacterium]